MKKYQFTKKKNLIFVIGLTLLGVCVTLIQKSNLGMSAWDAFNRNIYEGTHLYYVIINPVVAMILISFAYLLQKRKASLWMLFPLLISAYVGLVIDLLLLIIPSVVELSIWFNLAYLALAILICAVGLNMILYCEYPLPALDELCYGIASKLHISFGKGKLIGEIIAIILTVIAGLLFSFEEEYFFIGPTTIIFGLLIGFAVDFTKRPVRKLLVRSNE